MEATKELAHKLENLFTFSLLVYSAYAIGSTLFLMAVFISVTFYFKRKEEASSKDTLETSNKNSEDVA